jgi:SAM-dependent methyltransferase
MENINCPICNNQIYTFLFEAIDIKVKLERFNIIKCNNCGLIVTNPRPSVQEIGSYYLEDYYSYLLSKSKKNRKLPFNNKKFLDIGCGSGDLIKIKENEGFESFGVEISKIAVKNGKKTGQNIELYDGKQLPFVDNFFDLINLGNVIEHVHYINEILTEIKRVLKPNGLLTISVPNIESYDAQIYGKYWRHLDVPRHLYHFSLNTITNILTLNGLEIEQISTVNTPAFSKNYLAGSYTTIKTIIHLNSGSNNRIFRAIFIVFYNFSKYVLHRKSFSDGQLINIVAKIGL